VAFGETLHVGPLKNGRILEVTQKSAHVAQTEVQKVWAGHSACFVVSVSKNERTLLRQEMVALKHPFVPVQRFAAEVFLVKGKTVTISEDHCESTLHILHMKQAARVTNIFVAGCVNISEVTICHGGQATITFEVCRQMGRVQKGMKIIMRDGHVRGVCVLADIPQTAAAS
jgi:GTPase